jgi:hypothetical protein
MNQSRVIAAGVLRHSNRAASSVHRHRSPCSILLSSWNQRGHDITGEASDLATAQVIPQVCTHRLFDSNLVKGRPEGDIAIWFHTHEWFNSSLSVWLLPLER